jgi:putative tricarboxylic transport membrane protein
LLQGETVFSTVLFCSSLALFAHSFISSATVTARVAGGFWWPRALLAGIAILSGTLVLNQLRSASKDKLYKPSEEIVKGRLLGLIAACFAYAMAMNYAGFVFSTPFYIAIVLFLLGIRKTRSLTVLPIGITAMLFVVFVKVLHISVPRGVGPFLHFSRIFY